MLRYGLILDYGQKDDYNNGKVKTKEKIYMKKACRILGIIVLVLGIIGSIALAWDNGVVVTSDFFDDIDSKRSISLTIGWFAGGLLSTAVASVILFSISEILERLEGLSWRVSEVEGKLESAERKEKEADDITYRGSWRCPECGRVNASYVGTCGCGQTKA